MHRRRTSLDLERGRHAQRAQQLPDRRPTQFRLASNCGTRWRTPRTAGSLISTSIDGCSCWSATRCPAAGAGLDGATGCITQTPYYSPVDHTPAYQGACALLTVAGNPNQIGNDPTTWNVAALWGTVYAPSAALDIQPYDLQVPVFNRGFVARMAMLGYNPTGNAVVPITTTPTVQTIVGNRRMTFTANRAGQDDVGNGGRRVLRHQLSRAPLESER